MYEIGDKVKVTKNHHYYTVGDIVSIVEVDDHDDYQPIRVRGTGVRPQDHWLCENTFEVVPERPEAKTLWVTCGKGCTSLSMSLDQGDFSVFSREPEWGQKTLKIEVRVLEVKEHGDSESLQKQLQEALQKVEDLQSRLGTI